MESQFSSSPRRPCFNNEDNGLASIVGFCSNNKLEGCIMRRRGNNLRNIACLISSTFPRSNHGFDEIQYPHFLESCALCRKPLGTNRDIFMYRGDTPFCSEECRQVQIEIDEDKEKNRNYKAVSKKDAKKSSSTTTSTSSTSSPSKTPNYPLRTGTVLAS